VPKHHEPEEIEVLIFYIIFIVQPPNYVLNLINIAAANCYRPGVSGLQKRQKACFIFHTISDLDISVRLNYIRFIFGGQ